MRKRFSLLLLLCCCTCLLAQTRSSKVNIAPLSKNKGVTRAVVVGISDYMDEEIPDLQYAHRDAAAFAAWLESSAGGSVPSKHLQVLLNEEATIGRIVEALGWLMEESEADDEAILYFSGHGDVETITKYKRGFLLAHNAPPRSYMTGGVLALRDIEDITNTLSEKGVQVIIITDACRSGKLAGSQVNGAQYTSVQLAKRFSNEVKILSCQPEEYSSEGTQWGGGHGAFSYHLLDGLYGLADQNLDYQITLSEIDRYLEDHVPVEVAPLNQTPISFGRRNKRLAFVDEDLLAERKQKQLRTLPMIGDVAQKEIGADFLAGMDASVQQLYGAFDQALENKSFLEEGGADAYYQQLMEESAMAPLHSTITRKYAARLQDDAQSALNATLKLETGTIMKDRIALSSNYKKYPKYLQRSADLLGEKHYMYKSLSARSLFFEGLVEWFANSSLASEEKATEIMSLYQQSLDQEPYAPHTNYYMGVGFSTMYNNLDSASHYMELATQQSPTWVLPYTSMAFFYLQQRRFEEAKTLLDKSKTIDPDNNLVLQSIASWHYYQGQLDEAATAFSALLEVDSLNTPVMFNLGTIYLKTKKYDQAESVFKTAIKVDSTYHLGYYGLGLLYYMTDRLEEAEGIFLSSIKYNPKFISGRKRLGAIYYRQEKFTAARDIWKEAYLIKPKDNELCLNLASVSIDLEDKLEALSYLEKAANNGSLNYKEIIEDKEQCLDLSSLRQLYRRPIDRRRRHHHRQDHL